jgi:probable F420-dependent oxidoreductase
VANEEKPMKVGILLPSFGPLASGKGTVRLACQAEELGFDSVWVGDHIVYPPKFLERLGPAFYEAVTTLAYVAANTRQIRLGTDVLILPYRNPLVLAKQLATIDALSEGRLTVGVGTGWMEEEFAALGVSFTERGARTDEYLRVMQTLWREERPTFTGRFFEFAELLAAPRPLQQPMPPLWVGGNSPRALRRAAELGNGWLPIWHAPTGRGFTPESLREQIGRLADLTQRAGRHVAHDVAGLMPLAIIDRPVRSEEAQPLIGPPEVLVETLARYAAAGLGHVILNPYYGVPQDLAPSSLEDVGRLLVRFLREVQPHLRP